MLTLTLIKFKHLSFLKLCLLSLATVVFPISDNGRHTEPRSDDKPELSRLQVRTEWEELDRVMRGQGFEHASYPFYWEPNSCGPDGIFNLVVPNRPFHLADFSEACNKHDRCYMTRGRTFEKCNNEFKGDLLMACRKSQTNDKIHLLSSLCSATASLYAVLTTLLTKGLHEEDQLMQFRYEMVLQVELSNRSVRRL